MNGSWLRANTPGATGSNGVINVVFVIDELTQTLGGAEHALRRIITLLPRDKFSCSLVTFRLSPDLQVHDYFPCPVHHLPVRSVFDWGAILKLRRLLLNANAHIVQTFFESSDLYAGVVTKLCTSAKLVWTRRDMGILRSPKHDIAYRISSRWLPDVTLAVSESVRGFAIAHDRLRPQKTLTHYNGIDVPELLSSQTVARRRNDFNIPSGIPIVTALANIRRVKGIDCVLRTAAKVRESVPDAVFLIVGAVLENNYMEELNALAASLDLGNSVMFVGEQKDVNSILQMSDVGLLLSRSEGFSNALLESMAAGLPCVATDVGGNPEALRHEITGFLVDPEDIDSASEMVVRLLRNKKLAENLGSGARNTVAEKFSTYKMISDLEHCYETLLADHRS